jgi:uncharacterized protein YkwD
MVNAERVKAGLHKLRWDENYTVSAKIRVIEHAAHTDLGHNRPDGTRYITSIQELGINYQSAGENLANGGHSHEGAAWYDPERVMESWMNSPTHRQNILAEKFDLLGVAAYDMDGRRYYVQHFGRNH